ncbi:MAG: ASKHA domain-containing protein [Candidatus Bathyarchaeota archaeon]|jgi:uncharacterized 2Fe-2S/4Fe-4S cluster protein (DUF4445 family)
MPYPTVTFEPAGRRTQVPAGTTILEASHTAGARISSECGGRGSCGKCRIILLSGPTHPPTSEESIHLTPEELGAGWRLACQVRVEADLVVMAPVSPRGRKFQTRGIEREYPFNPLLKKIHTEPNENTLGSYEFSEEMADFFVKAINTRPQIGASLTLWRGERVLNVELGDTSQTQYGVAIDIGTSKVVGHLVDLRDGRVLGVASVENPQAIHGADVMSRLTFALQGPENQCRLRELSVSAFNMVVKILCSEAGVAPESVIVAVVVGNTLMHHLFLGLDTGGLSRAPFSPTIEDSHVRSASDLGVSIKPSGLICFPPVIAGFVGSDALADLVAVGVHDLDSPIALVDIGTNTEVFVGDRVGMFCCSCASGPAFEGAHITHGVRAVSGAIERLRIDPTTLEVDYETIRDGVPIGICGSGMIDALAELWKSGLLDGFGRIDADVSSDRVREGEGGLEFVVEWDGTGVGRDIVLTSGDIQELLLAKAAIHSACHVLLKRSGLKAPDLSSFYVAGAFGERLDPVNAMAIGMIPQLDPERIVFAGNTAVMGAKAMLVSEEAWELAEGLRGWIHYHELSLDPDFNPEFLDSVYLPHRDPERFSMARELRSRQGGISRRS